MGQTQVVPRKKDAEDPWEEETQAEGITLVVAALTDFHRFFTGF